MGADLLGDAGDPDLDDGAWTTRARSRLMPETRAAQDQDEVAPPSARRELPSRVGAWDRRDRHGTQAGLASAVQAATTLRAALDAVRIGGMTWAFKQVNRQAIVYYEVAFNVEKSSSP